MAKSAKSANAVDDLFGDEAAPVTAAPAPKGKKAAKAAPAVEAAPSDQPGPGRGRQAGQPRGASGVNMFGILRRVFSAARGATIEEGVAALTNAVEAASQAAPAEMLTARVRTFLLGARKAGQVESVGQTREGTERYRYTGEVMIARGRGAQAEAEAPAPVVTPKAAKVAAPKAAAPAPAPAVAPKTTPMVKATKSK